MEARADLARNEHEGFLAECGQGDAVLSRESVSGRQSHDQRLLADDFDHQASVWNREQWEGNLNLASPQGLDLLLGVEALELDLNVRMPSDEDAENSLENVYLRRRPATDRESPDFSTRGLVGNLHGVIGVAQDVACLLQKQAAGLGHRDRAPVSAEQLDAKLALEILNLVGEWRLRDVETIRGSAKVQLFGNGDEVAEVAKFQEAFFQTKDYLKIAARASDDASRVVR